MMNYDCKFYSYTNKQRVNETKKLKYQNIIMKYKDDQGKDSELIIANKIKKVVKNKTL